MKLILFLSYRKRIGDVACWVETQVVRGLRKVSNDVVSCT